MSVGIIAGNSASINVVTASITPAEVSTVTAPAQTFNVPGVRVGDVVVVTPPSVTAGVAIANARVSAANTVSIQFVNPTGGALTPPAGVHKFLVVRQDSVSGSVQT